MGRTNKTDCERFFEKVDAAGACWAWQGTRSRDGYGRFRAGRMVQAHRWAYEYLVGPIPGSLDLDHLCKNRRCVCPEHLEPVTRGENTRRGATGILGGAKHGLVERAKTHCPQGHPYDEGNTIWYRNTRYCRECQRKYVRDYMRRKRAESKAA